MSYQPPSQTAPITLTIGYQSPELADARRLLTPYSAPIMGSIILDNRYSIPEGFSAVTLYTPYLPPGIGLPVAITEDYKTPPITDGVVLTNGIESEPAPTDGTDQSLTLMSLEQLTQAATLDIATGGSIGITTVVGQQRMESETVNPAMLAETVAPVVQQVTHVEPLTPSQPSGFGTVEIEQLTQAQTAAASQVTKNTTVNAQSRTDVVPVSLAASYSLVTEPVHQLSQSQTIGLLDDTGLQVAVLEQVSQVSSYPVTLVLVLGSIGGEQLTEAEIASILTSATTINPRALRIHRTTEHYAVNQTTDYYIINHAGDDFTINRTTENYAISRTTDSFRVAFKAIVQ